jgi:hypothetical protein
MRFAAEGESANARICRDPRAMLRLVAPGQV